MTPQFLRSEAARFREMADAVTDREASRQRLLGMAADYEARAAAAEKDLPPEPIREAEPEPEPTTEAVTEAPPDEKSRGRPRLRLSRTTTLSSGSGKPGL
jgi:hypothetical protein